MSSIPYFKEKQEWGILLGGSGGFGWAAAELLAKEGMHLCIVHRDRRQAVRDLEDKIKDLKKYGVEIISFNVDANNPEKQRLVIDELINYLGTEGRVKLLLHAIAKGNIKRMVAGDLQKADYKKILNEFRIANGYTILEESLQKENPPNATPLKTEDFTLTMQLMGTSLIGWVNLLLNEKLLATDSRVLALTSEGGRKAWHGYAAVSAAKAALEAVCRSIALEYAPYGIRCNTIQPGVTDTAALRMMPGHELMKGNAAARNPFGRLTTPEDVAKVIYLMTRNESAWINGARIPVDGGEQNS